MEFNFVKLGEFAEVKGGKRLPKGTSLTDTKNSHPYLRIVDFKMHGINENNLKYVPDSVFEKISRYIINANDVFLSIVGTIGLTGILPPSLNGANLTENAVKIISKNKEILNPYYLMYYLSSPEGQFQISIRTVGSTQPKLAITRIKDIPIPLLEIEKQNKIVDLIHSLTGKVELNTKIIENLEYLAQTLFKRWFIDFEFQNEEERPYKSSGGEMVESEMGEIPKSWNVKSLVDIADYHNGLAMQKFRPEDNDNSLPVLKIKELNQGFIEKNGERCKVDIKESAKVYNGDVIFSWSGTLIVKLWVGGNAGLNQHLFKVTSESYPKWFYYYWTKHHLNQFIAIAADKATTMGHIKRSHL